jgi:hypothetical protein
LGPASETLLRFQVKISGLTLAHSSVRRYGREVYVRRCLPPLEVASSRCFVATSFFSADAADDVNLPGVPPALAAAAPGGAQRSPNALAGKVAMLLRLQWLEGAKRHERIFRDRAPNRVWVFTMPTRLGLWRITRAPRMPSQTARSCP